MRQFTSFAAILGQQATRRNFAPGGAWTAALANGYNNLHLAMPYIAQFYGAGLNTTGLFGSSAGYTPSTTTVTGTTLYYSATGLAGNSGASHLAPKNFGSLPTRGAGQDVYYSDTAGGNKYLIAAGDTLPLLGPRGIQLWHAGSCYASFDNNPASPTYGQEVNDFLDPWFAAVYSGYYPDLAYKLSRHFIIDGGVAIEDPTTPGNNGVGGVAFVSATDVNSTIKGCWIKNFRHSGATFQNQRGGRLLNCIIEDIARSPLAGDVYPGNGIRCEGPTSPAGYLLAGNWMRGINGDCIWAAYAGITGLQVMNNVVSSRMRRYSYESDHADGFQTVGPLEAAIIRKNVFDIAANQRYYPMRDPLNFAGLPKQIAAMRNNGTLGASTVDPIIEDNLFLSDQTAVQWTGNAAGDFAFRRNLALTNSSQHVVAGITPLRWENAAAMQDSITVLIKNNNPATACVSTGSGTTTKTTSQEFVLPGVAGAPHFTTIPTVTGTATQGQTLTATPATAAGSPTPTVTGQWMRESTGGVFTDIAGATATTYTLTVGDVGSYVRYRSDASNGDPSTMVSIISLGTAAVAAAAAAPTLVSSSIDAAGTTLTKTYSAAVTHGAGGNGGNTITASGGAATLTYASGAGTTALAYTISRAIQSTETVTTGYTQPGNGVEASTGATDVATYSGAAVTPGVFSDSDFQIEGSGTTPSVVSLGDTPVSGSSLLVWSAADTTTIGEPTDNKGNTLTQAETESYPEFPGYSFRLHTKANATGGTAHTVTLAKTSRPDGESTLIALMVPGLAVLDTSSVFRAAAGAGADLVSASVTVPSGKTARLLTLASGDGPTGTADQTFTLDVGWTILESRFTGNTAYVPAGCAAKDATVGPGTYTVTWRPAANQGAIIQMAAVEA